MRRGPVLVIALVTLVLSVCLGNADEQAGGKNCRYQSDFAKTRCKFHVYVSSVF